MSIMYTGKHSQYQHIIHVYIGFWTQGIHFWTQNLRKFDTEDALEHLRAYFTIFQNFHDVHRKVFTISTIQTWFYMCLDPRNSFLDSNLRKFDIDEALEHQKHFNNFSNCTYHTQKSIHTLDMSYMFI